jgi:hypothetical protein
MQLPTYISVNQFYKYVNKNVSYSQKLVQPGEFKDHLTEILRQGARKLVLQAVEVEFASFIGTL